ncbi:MAG: PaaI family thioesterase [Pseudomonadota bacterium]
MTRIATALEDLPAPAELLSMSGLAFMQGMLDGTLPGPPIAETMGYVLHSVGDGTVTFRGTPEFKVCNPMGTVHGGWYGTLLDSAMACAVMTKVPRGSVYTTLEYKINITRAIPQGMLIECVGTVEHSGRSTGVANGTLRGVEDGKLYATGSTTCIIMKMAD